MKCEGIKIKKIAIIGCDNSPPWGNINCDNHEHTTTDLYINIKKDVSPNLQIDITNPSSNERIPTETFDEIYLGYIGGNILTKKSCFENCHHWLKEEGSLFFDEYAAMVKNQPSIPLGVDLNLISNYKTLLFWA